MVRLAVINLKGLLKSIMKVIAVLLIFAMIIKISKLMYHSVKKFDLESIILQNKLEMMNQNLNIAQSFQEEPSEKSELKKILVAELAVFSGAEEEIMEKENQEEVLEFENVDNQVPQNEVPKEQPQEVAQETVPQENVESIPQENAQVATAVIEANNKKDVYTDTYHSVKIKNESKYALTEAMVTPDISYSDKKNIIL